MSSTIRVNWCIATARSLCLMWWFWHRIHWRCLSLPRSSSANRISTHRAHRQNMRTLSRHRIHLCKWSTLGCRISHLKIRPKRNNIWVSLSLNRILQNVLPYSPSTGSPGKNEHVNDNVVPLRTISTSKFGLLLMLSLSSLSCFFPSFCSFSNTSGSSESTVWFTLNLTSTLNRIKTN